MRPIRQSFAISPSQQAIYSVVQQEVELGANALGRGDIELALTLFESARAKLTPEWPFYDHLIHNLLLTLKQNIEMSLQRGESRGAAAYLGKALELDIVGEMSADTAFRQRFAATLQEIGLIFFRNSDPLSSLLCCRRATNFYAGPGSFVNLSNSLAAAGVPAELGDLTSEITREQLGRHIFIACVPKSASTFLKNLLLSLTGYPDMFSVYSAGQSEHEIYLPTLLENAHLNTVTQQHCRASDANVQIMQAFEIRPVVLVRNIFDSVMSLADFYEHGAYKNTYFRVDYLSLDHETRLDLIIDSVIPWYFQFVSSWDAVEKEQRLELCWLTYEELVGNKPDAASRVLEFYGLGAGRRAVEDRIKHIESQPRKTRFNKGVAGRGKAGLNEEQKERIRRLARYYPSTDFGRIGL